MDRSIFVEVRWPVVSGPLDFCGGEVAGEDGKGGGGGGEGEGGKGGGWAGPRCLKVCRQMSMSYVFILLQAFPSTGHSVSSPRWAAL